MANKVKDIYGHKIESGTATILTGKDYLMTVSSGAQKNGVEYLIQGISIQYQQSATPIYEIGSGNAYTHTRPPQGQIQIERIIGSKSIEEIFGESGNGIWDLSTKEDIKITIAPMGNVNGNAKGQKNGPRFIMHGCSLVQYSVSGSAQLDMFQESATITFALCEEK